LRGSSRDHRNSLRDKREKIPKLSEVQRQPEYAEKAFQQSRALQQTRGFYPSLTQGPKKGSAVAEPFSLFAQLKTPPFGGVLSWAIRKPDSVRDFVRAKRDYEIEHPAESRRDGVGFPHFA
jgi:hypothetical protein